MNILETLYIPNKNNKIRLNAIRAKMNVEVHDECSPRNFRTLRNSKTQ